MPRSSQRVVVDSPRRAMSSVKEVSRDRDCSSRGAGGATKEPEPCFWITSPSSTNRPIAWRTVTRDSPVIAAISRSGGSGLPGARSPCETASESFSASCR